MSVDTSGPVESRRPGGPDAHLDEVYVMAPMAGNETDNPFSPVAGAERFVRRMIAQSLATSPERLREQQSLPCPR